MTVLGRTRKVRIDEKVAWIVDRLYDTKR